MPCPAKIPAALATLVGIAASACGAPARTAPAPAVTPALDHEDHCWWAVLHSPLPADTVAARFAYAYKSVGLAGATWARSADTAWAQAGPTVLGGAHAGWTYAARVVAYQRGDSTHFRTFVSVAAPLGDPSLSDSARALGENPGTGRHIGFCAELRHAAQAQGTAPREPDGEEKLDVWRRRR